MIHTVRFNSSISFATQTGISFVNLTTAETAGTVTTSNISPLNKIQYSVTWLVDPAIGDIIEWQYDGLGDYTNTAGTPVEAQTLVLTNCLDPV